MQWEQSGLWIRVLKEIWTIVELLFLPLITRACRAHPSKGAQQKFPTWIPPQLAMTGPASVGIASEAGKTCKRLLLLADGDLDKRKTTQDTPRAERIYLDVQSFNRCLISSPSSKGETDGLHLLLAACVAYHTEDIAHAIMAPAWPTPIIETE